MQHGIEARKVETGPVPAGEPEAQAPGPLAEDWRPRECPPPQDLAAFPEERIEETSRPKRITLDPRSAIDQPPSDPLAEFQALPAVIREVEAGRKLIVPSSADLEVALAKANTLKDLINFDKVISVLKEACSQFKVGIDETIRVSSFDLITRRRIGLLLLQVETRGRDRLKRHAAILELVRELGPDTAKRCRALARLRELVFADYLRLMTEQHEAPSAAGALRHSRKLARAAGAAPKKARNVPAKKSVAASEMELSPSMLDACVRCLGSIDLLVGEAKVKAAVRVSDIRKITKTSRGSMLVVEGPDPAQSLRRVVELRDAGRIEEAIVALPRDVDAVWWSSLSASNWSLCVPSDHSSPIVAHIGGRARGFALVFAPLGVVAHVYATGDNDNACVRAPG